MSHRVRRLAAAVLSLPLLAGLAGPPAQAADPADPAVVKLTIVAKGCDNCTISLASARLSPSGKLDDFWQTEPVKLVGGRTTVEVPREQTTGMSISIDAPWDGHLPYATLVAMRYRGHAVGERISARESRAGRRASACWAGTKASEATLSIGVRKVRVQGHTTKVWGTRAWVRTTPEWLPPMRRSVDGVLGTQDLVFCDA